jgi:beta-barrel assembly-enhancing protease
MRPMPQRFATLVLALSMAVPACAMRKPGEPLKPGFNLFSKQQDIQLGQQAAAEIAKQYQIVQNQDIQNYVKRIGERLAAQKEAKASGFPFSFTVVNDPSINAFALPGGPTFVHTGLIAAADNEAQVAGVIGHELAHVILRHGTNQASKANLVQIPAMLAGAVTGSDLWGALAQMGGTALLLKYSRNAETEADALGARLMNDAGYNPIEAARFFEKLQAEGSPRAPEFLSSHPNPGNRVQAVQAEVRALPQRQYNASAGDFGRIKQLVGGLPAPPKQQGALPGASGSSTPAPTTRPSGSFKQLQARGFSLQYPDNWEAFGDNDSASVTIAPREGILQSSGGGSAIGYGAIVSFFFPESQNRNLQQSTDQLIQRLRASNPSMEVSGGRRRVSVQGSQGLVTTMTNTSPYQGATETDVLLTVQRPEGLFYMIFIAPQQNFQQLQSTFDAMVRSIRFTS